MYKGLTRWVIGALLGAGACAFSGCSSSQTPVAAGPLSGEEKQQEAALVAQQTAEVMATVTPPRQEQPAGKRNLVIAPGDSIRISVWLSDRVSQLSGFPVEQVIPDSGEIFLPHLGMIQAAGKTTTALKADLQFNFDKILSESYIAVTHDREKISGSDSRTSVEVGNHFIILGHVARPGVFPLSPGLRLRDGIAMAGGFQRYALKKVFLVRGERDAPEVLRVNLDQIMQGVDLSQNVTLAANDAIYVPPKKLWEISDFISTLLMPIVSVRDAMWVIDRVTEE